MEPIAIIGYANRFPGGANTPSKFWDLLVSGRDISQEPSQSRLNLSKIHSQNPDIHGTSNVLKSYFLEEDPALFDASFFGVSPLEAEAMDPQQRLLLETVYEATESAGLPLAKIKGSRTSVYVGVMTADYGDIQARDVEDQSAYSASGISRAMLANRISYAFDLRGSSVCLDTACSSSLVALHHAMQDLSMGPGADMAVVAGCSLILDPLMYIMESKLHMLSPTGTSKMWDAGADGYARGEGVAAIIVKPLSKAVRDGDPIRGVVRAAGVNSDGRTPGITMPSATAQARLIKDTYRAAGLDLRRSDERCQYFEAHGTGTPAGDPVEAQGIFQSFYDPKTPGMDQQAPLTVGSVKTVVGHLEGCAGLAGVIKVLLAMEHNKIPPNLHLRNINPKIKPLIPWLQIPTDTKPWPQPPAGQPKRASVNSFGFGGTNAHAIIESYEPEQRIHDESRDSDEPEAPKSKRLAVPIILSAHTESSLRKQAQGLLQHLRANPDVNIKDLSWTLMFRRSELGVRLFVLADSREDLERKLQERLDKATKEKNTLLGSPLRTLVSPNEGVGILGVFTGQGAQWAGMGRELIEQNSIFRDTISKCQAALDTLPVTADRPGWSLAKELQEAESNSRIAQAEFAQPATTAIEIALVDLLKSNGVRFAAVVGHSSGEIAACYAAGILNLADAMRIAYYRGKHARLASGKGAMLAVGLSWDAAEKQIAANAADLRGRLWLAANNSPSSVTISGDSDAIHVLHAGMQRAGTFSRLLKTEKAYHSPHMQPCSEAYLRSIQTCRVQPRTSRNQSCVWVSTVDGNADRFWDGDLDDLAGQYWIDNMVQPVLFADAIAAALTNGGPFDMAVEVGPHPALKSPVHQTIQPLLKRSIPYCGAMIRGSDCVTSFSNAIGFSWINFGTAAAISFPNMSSRLQMIKDLPAYSWDHNKPIWRESRISKNHRLRHQEKTFLLGRRCPDDFDTHPRWRNMLSLAEIPWLRGHAFEGEALYPAAAYIVMMLEVAQFFSSGRKVAFVELSDLIFDRTLRLADGGRGMEIITSARVKDGIGSKDVVHASVEFGTCQDAISGAVDANICTGSVAVYFAPSYEDCFAPRILPADTKTQVNTDELYSMFDSIGLQYSGVFRGLASVNRGNGLATATASWKSEDVYCSEGLIHPGLIDTCIHPIFAAFAAPAMNRVKTAYLPQKLKRLIFNPELTMRRDARQQIEVKVEVDAYVTNFTPTSLVGDYSVYLPDKGHDATPLIQVEGLSMSAFGPRNPDNDLEIFSQTVWEPDLLGSNSSEILTADQSPSQDDMVIDAERVALYVCRAILTAAENVGISNIKPHEQQLVSYAQDKVSRARNSEEWTCVEFMLDNNNTRSQKNEGCSWLADDKTIVDSIMAKHSGQIDFQLLRAVGNEIEAVFRNEKPMLEVLFANNMLGRYYSVGLGLRNTQRQVARYLQSILHRYPRANIIELGAGVGATTRAVLDSVGPHGFASYTFTDVSTGFFTEAEECFAAEHRAGRMVFRKLDVCANLQDQGFEQETYDVVIAANVLHIAPDVEQVLQRVRSLLRPGGFLVAAEPTGSLVQVQLILGGLEGWWLATDGCRTAGPQLSIDTWDAKLWDAGFSGLEVMHHDQSDERLRTCTSFVTQALSESMVRLRQPLAHVQLLPPETALVIIGGSTAATSRVVREIRAQLSSLLGRDRLPIIMVRDIGSVKLSDLPRGCSALYVGELDKPAIRGGDDDIDPAVLNGLQALFSVAQSVLVVTHGAGCKNPSLNMIVGLCRALRSEIRSLRLQVLDLEDWPARLETGILLDHYVRFVITPELEDENVLFSDESELLLRSGNLYIPRIRKDIALNNRVNTARRVIWAEADAQDHVLSLMQRNLDKGDQSGYEIFARPKVDGGVGLQEDVKSVTVKVKYSTLIPVEQNIQDPGHGEVYLCVGTVKNESRPSGAQEQLAFLLSSSNKSVVMSSSQALYLIPKEHDVSPGTVGTLSLVLAARAWVRHVPAGSTISMHGEFDEVTLSILETEAKKVKVKVHWTSSCTKGQDICQSTRKPTVLHRNMPFRQLKAIFSNGLSAIILAKGADKSIASSIKTALGLDHILCNDLLCLPTKTAWADLQDSSIAEELDAAYSSVNLAELQANPCPMAISLQHISAESNLSPFIHKPTGLAIIDWTATSPLRAKVQSIDAKMLFRPDRTYFLVGLTRDLGLSICSWMVEQGARHLALASRNPNISQDWLDSMTTSGISVKIFSMDVADYQAVLATVDKIKREMPPVAGICNGSMLLSDKLFTNLDAAGLMTAIRPKVNGSLNLERAFSGQEKSASGQKLDFSIFFASTGSIIGVPGQSGYHMANRFMSALASNRRSRGLAASVIDIGVLVDVGYVARQDASVFRNLQIMHTLPNWEDEVPLQASP